MRRNTKHTKTVTHLHQASFRGGTRVNAVPIVEKLSERMGTPFPLLRCLITHYGRHIANHFHAKMH